MMLLDKPGVSTGLTMLPDEDVTGERVTGEQTVRRESRLHPRELTITSAEGHQWAKPPYIVYLERELNRLLGLAPDWNGARARATSDAAALQAAQLLIPLLGHRTILPQLFPLVDGGIQIEWHVGASDIEIEVEGNGSTHVFASEESVTLLDGEPAVDLPNDWQIQVRALLRRLSSQVRATNRRS